MNTMLTRTIIILTVLQSGCYATSQIFRKSWARIGNPLASAKPCNGSDDLTAQFEPVLPPDQENQYDLSLTNELPISSKVIIQFDSEATVNLAGDTKSSARISSTDGGNFEIKYYNSGPLKLHVIGPPSGTVPYVTSFVVNTVEYCDNAQSGYFDKLIIGNRNTAVSVFPTTLEGTNTSATSTCGRRKVDHTELIANGQPTKPGDWPWHVALYRFSGTSLNYICGGTLISKTTVLTAAHCVTRQGAPILKDRLNVILGKYNLVGGDISSEERQVHKIIVHESYDHRHLNHDIAVLKLSSEAVYNDYIQPACLWSTNSYKQLPTGKIFGTIVGWGFDQTDTLSSELQQAKMPKVSESTCLKSNAVFFSTMLTEFKFCAGYRNGTSACNGDSGGGFHVFVPDLTGDSSANATGSWHVRGIVSTSISRSDAPICDPTHYVLFTDVAKYKGWISRHMA